MAVETKPRVTKGKAKGIDACADDRGIIRAAAMDQRGSLMRQIGQQGGQATPASLTEFKTAVTKVLTPYASAVLMDPEYGLPALRERYGPVSTVGYGRAVRQASCCGCGIGNGSSEKNVRQLRLAKGIPQERLACAANLDRTYIGGIERGRAASPRCWLASPKLRTYA